MTIEWKWVNVRFQHDKLYVWVEQSDISTDYDHAIARNPDFYHL